MTVYYDKRRQHWCYDFVRNGTRFFGYCRYSKTGVEAASRRAALKFQRQVMSERPLERSYRSTTMGYLYFALAPDSSLVKIGWSGRPRKRIRALKSGSPIALMVIGQCRGTLIDEGTLHKRLAAHRSHGEWFRFSDEVAHAITIKLEHDCAREKLAKLGLAPPICDQESQTSGTHRASTHVGKEATI